MDVSLLVEIADEEEVQCKKSSKSGKVERFKK